MSRFIQLHLLTAYPPANLNRDDQGSPKTARMGGYDRLRVSSQCLKRTWRTSSIFEDNIAKGVRTKMIGVKAFEQLSKFPTLSRTESETIAKNIAQAFGKLKTNSLELETLAFISDEEQNNIDRVINGFSNGLGGATEESNSLGVQFFKLFASDIQVSIEKIIEILKSENQKIMLNNDWNKLLKNVIKTYKTTEDKSPYDFFSRMIENSDKWLSSVCGDIEIRNDQIEIFLAEDATKLTKDILKKLSLGVLLSGANAKETVYGEVKNKEHIKLCKGWEEQVSSWIEDVKKSEDEDYLSEDNIQMLKTVISPVAIAKSSILTNKNTNADIALFGRMLASSTRNNVEAACQVAHAISVHSVVIEDDYFTAVDDLNKGLENMGAAHIGETRFAAGLFYAYICINRDLLVKNLDGNEALANQAIRALTEAAVKVAPEGKQNSFASRAYASYVLVEKGDQQPRSLSVAYLKPISNANEDYAVEAVAALLDQFINFDTVYGACAEERRALNALSSEQRTAVFEALKKKLGKEAELPTLEEVSLADLLNFIAQ